MEGKVSEGPREAWATGVTPLLPGMCVAMEGAGLKQLLMV